MEWWQTQGMQEFQLPHNFIASSTAALQAMLFDSPIGGIVWSSHFTAKTVPKTISLRVTWATWVTSQVYMFEEITSSSWPVEVGLQLGSDL